MWLSHCVHWGSLLSLWASVLALPTCPVVVVASASVERTCKFPWDNFLAPGAQCGRVVVHNPRTPCPADLVLEQP